ncbi:MAG: VOC family protein [Flavobacteriales bacterium]|nr:VOC family protein [Flavobacteriales bacterium]
MGSTAKPASRKAAAPKEYVSWFEIPAYDLGRAKIFFDHVFGINMDTHHAGEYAMAYFPPNGSSGGAVVQGPGCIPSDCGALIYLNAGEDLDGMLSRAEEAGGRVVMGRTLISENAGSFALIVDSEGNRLALHEKPNAATRPVASKAGAKAGAPRTKKATVKRKAAPKKVAGKKR